MFFHRESKMNRSNVIAYIVIGAIIWFVTGGGALFSVFGGN